MTLRRTKLNNIRLKKLTGEEVWYNSQLQLYSLTSDFGSTWTTIADRDLGANYQGESGQLFQWGNNYGFPYTGTVTTASTTPNVTTYGPENPYSSSTFDRNTSSSSASYTYNSSLSNTGYGANLWGYYSSVTDRRGPCEEGMHVPTQAEANYLVTCLKNLGYTSAADVENVIYLPCAGSLDLATGQPSNQGYTMRYWTCQPNNIASNSYIMYGGKQTETLSPVNLGTSYGGHASGFSIRPFYNEGIDPTEEPEGLSFGTFVQIGASGNYELWYNEAEGTFSFTRDGRTTWYSLSDKNLGATTRWGGLSIGGNLYTEETCGKYYQWGNNYGFSYDGATNTQEGQISLCNYAIGVTGYSSNTFMTVESGSWMANPIQNLWGGVTGTNEARQGPCSTGFHIPTRAEMSSIQSFKSLISLTTYYYYRNYSSTGGSSSYGGYNNSGAYRWTCETGTSTSLAYGYRFYDNSYATRSMAYGYPIRPFKNEPIVPSVETGWTRTYQGSVTKTITGVYKGTEKIWPESNLLRFIADEAGSTIQLKTDYDTGSTLTLETSTDGTTWTPYTVEPNAAGTVITLDNVGDAVYFRNANNLNGFSTGGEAYYQFVMTGSIYAKGDINYLYSKISTDTVGPYAYYKLFDGCTALKSAPDLPAVCLGTYCYAYMFNGCTGLTEVPYCLPATALANYCYYYMFRGCTSLVNTPSLPATTLDTYCYAYMFQGCTSLTAAPNLLATSLASSCYRCMFSGCTSLVAAPDLPATTLGSYCYQYMFEDCTSLVNAPTLPATTLGSYCYRYMFSGCTSLVAAPDLPATTLVNYCYDHMFYGCTALTTAPDLPATTLSSYCYRYMFGGCTSLVAAPDLPATTLANYCYAYMFEDCTSLTTVSALPATILPSYCYSYMFSGCSNLTTLPALYVTSFASTSFRTRGEMQYMFQNCSKIKISTTQTDEYVNEYRIPIIGDISVSATGTYMFQGTGGTFTGSPTLGTTYYTSNTVAYQN